MADNIQVLPVIVQRGLNTSQNHLMMSQSDPGQAVKLVNYEANSDGGYRRINGYQKIHPTYYTIPGEGKVLGIWSLYDSTANSVTLVGARKAVGSNTYKIWQLTDAGWTEMVTGTTRSSVGVNRVRGEIANFGTGLFLVIVDGANPAAIYKGGIWYNITSANTGTDASPGGNQLLDRPSLVAIFRNHIFLSGDPDYPAIVCHSAPLKFTDWTAASGGGQITTTFSVVQITPFRDNLFVFGRERIKSIGVNNTTFVLQDVTDAMGCIAPDSVLEIGGNLIFWSQDGIRPIAGTERQNDIELSLLSQQIQSLMNSYANNYPLDQLCAVAIRKKTQFRYFLPYENEDRAYSRGIIGNYRRNTLQDSFWEFGELQGIKPAVCFSGYQGTKEVVLFGDYFGRVYYLERGNSFDGTDITSIFTTPYLDAGAINLRKNIKTLQIFVNAEGSFNLNFAFRYEWGDMRIINPADYNLGDTGDSVQYDGSFIYNSGIKYVKASQSVLKQSVSGSGHSFQITFVTTDQNPPHILQGYVLEYTTQGRQ